MSRFAKGKHVLTTALQEEIPPPGPGQAICRAVGSRGGNLVEVERPDGTAFLAVLPTKFHKRLWVKRGGYLIIDLPDGGDGGGGGGGGDGSGGGGGDGGEQAGTGPSTTTPSAPGKIAGVIAAVLYDPDVRRLRGMDGVWPPEFAAADEARDGDGGGGGDGDGGGAGAEDDNPSSSDDGSLPPLEANPNRRRYAAYSEVEEEEEE